jgi:hypothetical protein
MVQVVSGGVSEFNALAYQERHPSTIGFLQGQFENARSAFTEAGSRFVQGAKDLFERFNGDEALRRARALARTVKNAFQRNEIRSIFDLAGLQAANQVMQRWNMANPTLRQMYHDQRVDGYSDSYVDMHPGQIGDDHYDYRLVTNGMVLAVPKQKGEEEEGWKVTFYFEDAVEGDRHLDVSEQSDILSTWDVVEAMLKIGEDDPSNQRGGKL